MRPVAASNPITEMRRVASQQQPAGSHKHSGKHRHNPSQGCSGRTKVYKGTSLVAWFIEHNMLDQAEALLNKLIEQEGEQK